MTGVGVHKVLGSGSRFKAESDKSVVLGDTCNEFCMTRTYSTFEKSRELSMKHQAELKHRRGYHINAGPTAPHPHDARSPICPVPSQPRQTDTPGSTPPNLLHRVPSSSSSLAPGFRVICRLKRFGSFGSWPLSWTPGVSG